MKHFTTDKLCASFLLDGKKIRITPGTYTYDGGLAVTLEHSKAADNADYLKIHLKNTGDANTARIRNVKTLDLDVTTAEVPLYHSLDGDDCGAVSFMPARVKLPATRAASSGVLPRVMAPVKAEAKISPVPWQLLSSFSWV